MCSSRLRRCVRAAGMVLLLSDCCCLLTAAAVSEVLLVEIRHGGLLFVLWISSVRPPPSRRCLPACLPCPAFLFLALLLPCCCSYFCLPCPPACSNVEELRSKASQLAGDSSAMDGLQQSLAAVQESVAAVRSWGPHCWCREASWLPA